jgi:hypothetical protein
MKLDLAAEIITLLEAGGEFDGERYFVADSAGCYHRSDGPALIRPDGTVVWYQHGLVHRVGGPAIIYASGAKEWCRHGHCERREKA